MAASISNGGKLNYTCTGAVSNAALIIVGTTPGVALTSGVTGDVIAVAISGVFSLTKKAAASTNWAQGGRVGYITTGGVNKLTGALTSGKLVGTGYSAAVTGATTGEVMLHGGVVPSALYT